VVVVDSLEPDDQTERGLFELPAVGGVVEERLGTTRGSGRVDVIAGNVLTDELLYGYGAFVLANVVHCYTPEIDRSILRRIRAHAILGPPAARRLLDRSDARPAGRSSVQWPGVRHPRQ
jgi:hypothetical protein